jgi:hypothetical protein
VRGSGGGVPSMCARSSNFLHIASKEGAPLLVQKGHRDRGHQQMGLGGGGAGGYGGGTQRLGGRALDGQRKEGWLCDLEEATIGGCWAHVWSHMRKLVKQRGVGSRMAGCRGWSGLVIPCRELGNTTHPRWGRGGFDLSLYRP